MPSIFKPKTDAFTVVCSSEEELSSLTSRDTILEALKKQKGIEEPEKLPMKEYLAFRKELFELYKKADV